VDKALDGFVIRGVRYLWYDGGFFHGIPGMDGRDLPVYSTEYKAFEPDILGSGRSITRNHGGELTLCDLLTFRLERHDTESRQVTLALAF
jgi:hypothetical protein